MIRFLGCLKVPSGDLVGQRLEVQPFQQRFVQLTWPEGGGIRTSILSMGRKNAKTATCAGLALAGLIGPLARRNGEIVSVARSKKQSGQLYKYLLQMIDLMGWRGFFKVQESQKTIKCGRTGVEFSALSSDKESSHGGQPFLAFVDELGQVRGPTDALYEAVASSTGAYDDGLVVILSTQAATNQALLSTLVDTALDGADPTMACLLYTAEEDLELDDREAWAQANPGLGVMRSESDIAAQAFKAKLIPSQENAFRNLILNQRVSTTESWITAKAWEPGSDAIDWSLFQREPVYAGLDLSSRRDLTALCLAVEDPDTAEIHIRLWFWTPEHELEERARRDRADYPLWARDGYLEVIPGQTIDYGFAATRIAEIASELNLVGLAYDRWRMDVMRQELDRIGALHVVPLIEHGQGYRDMSPALEETETAIALGLLRHGGNPVLRYCVQSTRTRQDPAGNRKPDKALSFGHIDGTAAMLMAIHLLRTGAVKPGLVDTQGMIVLG